MSTVLHARPEALADVPGMCELPLTRAVVQYREQHEIEGAHGGRIDDIGIGLVLDGEYAASAEVLDLGSAEVRQLDLTAELVILDWVYEPTLDYVRLLLNLPRNVSLASGDIVPGALLQYTHAIALSVLRRAGFNALTRPTLLRLGYRDVVRDLDLNQRTAVRIALAPGDLARVHLDYDNNALLVQRRRADADPALEDLLADAFPSADRRQSSDHADALYQFRFPLPLSLGEVRSLMHEIRLGLLRLYANYEPERHEVIVRALETFGPRNTLEQLQNGEAHAQRLRYRARWGAASPAA